MRFTPRLVDDLLWSPRIRLRVRWWCPSPTAMAESPFALLGRYPVRGRVPTTSVGVTRPSSLLRAHAPDHVPPPAYGPPSVWGSVPVAANPCCDVALPDVISACLSLDAWTLTPGGAVGACTHYFPTTIGLPPVLMGSASRVNPFSDFRTGGDVGAAVIHSCSGLEVCCHPGRSHRSTLQHWAAVAYTSERNTGRYLPVHRIC